MQLIKIFFQMIWHFLYYRPDKILVTIILPFIIICTQNYNQNMLEYKKFIFDK